MKVTVLDGAHFTDKSAAHEYIAAMLEFPEYYGKNLDALYDCLCELRLDVGIIIVNTTALKCALSEYADSMIETFFDALGGGFRVCIFE